MNERVHGPTWKSCLDNDGVVRGTQTVKKILARFRIFMSGEPTVKFLASFRDFSLVSLLSIVTTVYHTLRNRHAGTCTQVHDRRINSDVNKTELNERTNEQSAPFLLSIIGCGDMYLQ